MIKMHNICHLYIVLIIVFNIVNLYGTCTHLEHVLIEFVNNI